MVNEHHDVKLTAMGLIRRRVQRFQAEMNELRCPHCRRVARSDATVCSHCGRDIAAPITKPLAGARAVERLETARLKEKAAWTNSGRADAARRRKEAEADVEKSQGEPGRKTGWPTP